jgi:CRISPR system Cascade subunit CasD
MNYLAFHLYAQLASWGGIAPGGNRHTADYPSKSALIGLIAAALGINRNDHQQLQNLANNLTFAIALINAGDFLQDYHTTEVPTVAKQGFKPQTRRDELVVLTDKLNTILSNREYRIDASYNIAVAIKDNSLYSAEAIQQALLEPKYHLYLGRKSCPLAKPMQPEVIQADCFFNALEQYQQLQKHPSKLNDKTRYYWEGAISDFKPEAEIRNQTQQLTRHDMPISRTRWQFAPRQEYLWLNNREAT